MRVGIQPVGPPIGNTLEEMKQNYEQQRDQEFVSHACVNPATAKTANKK
jgi:hypothetical protein